MEAMWIFLLAALFWRVALIIEWRSGQPKLKRICAAAVKQIDTTLFFQAGATFQLNLRSRLGPTFSLQLLIYCCSCWEIFGAAFGHFLGRNLWLVKCANICKGSFGSEKNYAPKKSFLLVIWTNRDEVVRKTEAEKLMQHFLFVIWRRPSPKNCQHSTDFFFVKVLFKKILLSFSQT